MTDLGRAMEHHSIAHSMASWNRKDHDDLEPKGATASEVLDHWLACRATIFDVGLGQLRYGLTNDDVAHLGEHLQKWLDETVPPSAAGEDTP